jgi:hypothetical protein
MTIARINCTSCFTVAIEDYSTLGLLQLFAFRGIKQAEVRLIVFANQFAHWWMNSNKSQITDCKIFLDLANLNSFRLLF